MELTQDQHAVIIKWIMHNLTPTDKINYDLDTSDIRRSFIELYRHGFYIDNYTLNSLLDECGFIHGALTHEPYLRWNISSKSRAIQIYRSYLREQSKDWTYE